MIIIDIDNMAD